MPTRRTVLVSGMMMAMGAALAACTQTGGLHAGPAAQDYTIVSVDVGVAPDAGFQMISLDGMSDAEQGEKIKVEVRRAVTAEVSTRRAGPKKAHLEIALRLVDVASGAGRILGSLDSQIIGDVRLVDSQTKAVIAFQPNLRAVDQGARNNSTIGAIPIGAIASLAVNAAGADRTYQSVAEAYAKAVGRWLID